MMKNTCIIQKKDFWKNQLTFVILVLSMIGILSGCQNSLPEGQQFQNSNRQVEDIQHPAGKQTNQISTNDQMTVHFIDVGQADATLIQLKDAAMLIDGGNHDDEEMLLGYLQSQGVEKLDYVIGTHPHEDHIGSLGAVIDQFQVEEVILPDQAHTSLAFASLMAAIDQKGLSITLPEIGKVYDLGNASFTILAPNGDYGNNLNNWSVGIRLVYGKDSFLFSGDAEEQAERDILNNGLELSSEVFKIGHHGSDTSNSSDFLNKVAPVYGVISCGKGNSYGHPNEEVLQALQERGVQVFRTDEQGTIKAVSSGNGITWSTQAGSPNKSQEAVPSQTAAEELVHITESGKKYHRAGCSYLKGSDRAVSLEKAKEMGLEPCSKCSPPKQTDKKGGAK